MARECHVCFGWGQLGPQGIGLNIICPLLAYDTQIIARANMPNRNVAET